MAFEKLAKLSGDKAHLEAALEAMQNAYEVHVEEEKSLQHKADYEARINKLKAVISGFDAKRS